MSRDKAASMQSSCPHDVPWWRASSPQPLSPRNLCSEPPARCSSMTVSPPAAHWLPWTPYPALCDTSSLQRLNQSTLNIARNSQRLVVHTTLWGDAALCPVCPERHRAVTCPLALLCSGRWLVARDSLDRSIHGKAENRLLGRKGRNTGCFVDNGRVICKSGRIIGEMAVSLVRSCLSRLQPRSCWGVGTRRP
jgi:hypothetical protein